MKSYNNLFNKMLDDDFIRFCIKKASKGKRKRKDVQKVLGNVDKHIAIIKNMLVSGSFRPRKHSPKIIVERGKERKIVKPDFRYEAIIQCMVVECLEPIFMKKFYTHSFASIPGRGIARGKKVLERCMRNAEQGKGLWCLKLDIRKFFETIRVHKLKDMLAKLIRDKKFLDICFVILDSSPVPGLPLGFVTSQWFANFYLTAFDHKVKERVHHSPYLRYMDDMVILMDNPMILHEVKNTIEKELSKLGLELKPDWQVFKVSGDTGRPIDYMGFKFYTNRTTLRKTTLYKTRKRVLKLSKKGRVTRYDASSLISRLGWMKQAQVYRYFKKHIAPLVSIKRLRKIVSKGGSKHGLLPLPVYS